MSAYSNVHIFNQSLYDVDNLYSYLKSSLSNVCSVSRHCEDIYKQNSEVKVFTDNALSPELESNLAALMAAYTNPMHKVDINAFRKISYINSTHIPLCPNETFGGQWEDVSNYSTISVYVRGDNDSSLNGFVCSFSTDLTDQDDIQSVTIPANTYTPKQFTVTARYFKVKYTNGNSFNNISIQTIFHHYRNKSIGTSLVSNIDDTYDCEVNRAVINGRLGNGKYFPVDITSAGYLKMAITSPISCFNNVSVAFDTPLFQHDFAYGINQEQCTLVQQNNASVVPQNGMVFCTSGPNAMSSACFATKQTLYYKAGQGCLGRFTGLFDSPRNGNEQYVGFGNSETQLCFAYINEEFGIIYTPRNKVQKHTIVVQSPPIDAQTITITLAGVSFAVPVSPSDTPEETAWEIASFDYASLYPGWVMSATGSSIDVLCLRTGEQTGEFAINFPSSGSATITRDWVGANDSTVFIPQHSWNVDTADGSKTHGNPSGTSINPQKGNVYFVRFQYLGFGYIEFGLEDPITSEEIVVHQIKYTSQNEVPNLYIPVFPFFVESHNTTNNTPVRCSSASAAAFIQGTKAPPTSFRSITNTKHDVGTSVSHVLTVRPKFIHFNKQNWKHLLLLHLNLANVGTSACRFSLIKNARLDKKTVFQSIDVSSSIVQFDVDSNSIQDGYEVYTVTLGPNTDKQICLQSLDIHLEHLACMSISAKTITNGSTTDVECTLVVGEE